MEACGGESQDGRVSGRAGLRPAPTTIGPNTFRPFTVRAVGGLIISIFCPVQRVDDDVFAYFVVSVGGESETRPYYLSPYNEMPLTVGAVVV